MTPLLPIILFAADNYVLNTDWFNQISGKAIRLLRKITYPANIYLFKAKIETLKKGVKYVERRRSGVFYC